MKFRGRSTFYLFTFILFMSQYLRFSYYNKKCSEESAFNDPQVLLEICYRHKRPQFCVPTQISVKPFQKEDFLIPKEKPSK